MQPFSVYRRSNSPYYYVSYKNEETGKQLPAISTRETNKTNAYKVAWQWYKEGVPYKRGNLKTVSFRDSFRTADLSPSDVEFIIDNLKQRGLILSAIFPSAPDSTQLVDFLLEFWDYDRSPYVREKLRKEHSIHKYYVKENRLTIIKYWSPYFNNKLLGCVLSSDLDDFINHIFNFNLSASRKNKIIKIGTIALRWAFRKGKISTDITQGLMLFPGKSNKRNILTPELVSSIFSQEWYDLCVKVANTTA